MRNKKEKSEGVGRKTCSPVQYVVEPGLVFKLPELCHSYNRDRPWCQLGDDMMTCPMKADSLANSLRDRDLHNGLVAAIIQVSHLEQRVGLI